MNWTAFQSHGEAPTGAFEAFCNQLFDLYCKREYSDRIVSFAIVNGSGGDGGVEAYAKLDDDSFVGIQSKWFLNSIEAREIGQIRNSVRTAMTVRPTLQTYIVCIPRDLASSTARTTNSEDTRWASFIKEMRDEYPNMEIILWHESKLREELQLDVTGGIRRYWFEQEELSVESMKFQFLKAKAGWLQPKYIPSLHGQGRIHDEIKNILPDRSRYDEWMRLLKRNLESVQFIKKEIIHAISFFQQKELTAELVIINQYLSQVEPNLVQLVESCQYGTEPKEFSLLKRPNLDRTLELLDNIPIRSLTSINKSDITRAITQLSELEIEEHLLQIKNLISQKMYAFLGEPGTGKTHGVANAIEEHVELGNNPGFIIQAKSYTASGTWRSILADSVGLSASWTEEEIWRGLEACAFRCDVKNARGMNANHEFVPTKVLMCIDGLDESIPWDHWHEKIRELQIITERFPRIRVVVASRPYVFSSATLHGLTPIHLSSEGDLRVGDLFERYLQAYHIRFEETEYFAWLRWSLKTPLALRLFCDQYSNQTLHKQDGVSTTISHLLAGRIKQVDEEIGRSLGDLWNTKDQLVLRALLSIVKHLLEHSSIERSVLSSLILDSVPNGAMNVSVALHMIDFLTKYGLLYEIAEQTNPLIPTTVRYEVATQPLMDYLLAVKLVEDFSQNGQVSIPEIFFKRVGAQQMVAIMLLQDHNTLVTQQIGWKRSNLFDIQLFALANVSADKTVPYVEKTREMLVKSMPLSRRIVNELVGRVARVPNHPLGPRLLHDVLLAFKTPAERDLFWSLPEYVPGQGDYSWEGHGACICSIEEYELFHDDLHWGLPLLYAWNLTNTDNTIRNSGRKKLTIWGMQNPIEFTELLKLTFETNDPQMKEDLVCCAYGVASRLTHERIALKALAEWALSAIFHKDRIQSNMNAVVRFAGRAITERAMVYGAISEEEIQIARPPHSPATEIMMLNPEAASAGRDGFEPIDGDLSWYVIKKGYEDFFQIDDEVESSQPLTQIERAPTSLLLKLFGNTQDISVKQEIEKELSQREEKRRQHEQYQVKFYRNIDLTNVFQV